METLIDWWFPWKPQSVSSWPGTWQEPQRSVILASVAKQDDLEDEEAGSGDMLDAIFGD